MHAKLCAAFERDGFLVVPGFVDAATCAALRGRAGELVAGFEPRTVSVFSTNEQTRTSDDYFLESGGEVRFFFEEEAFAADGSLRRAKEESINKIGHALHAREPAFAAFSQGERLVAIARALGLARPALVQSMYIFKNAFIGGDVSCHQDASFLQTDPPSVVGLWFALEDATIENGCMWALPGGHRGPLRKRFARARAGGTVMHTLDATPLPAVATAAPWVPLEAKAGTMILLHGLLPHFSCANRSARSRHAYALHFVDDTCAWVADNWLRRA
ncbi:MAG: phytanoyl-CoA dioxygenase family protein [Labilithrix sp.]|nr:phytanoyl-CoA dioxygenase family protein [Labilithrix sp.]MCW5812501.1 phytanoyl-CoA dioxygenase family protein [Labilithrix sp.]